MTAPTSKTYITPEEYLRREREAEVKSEYWDGVLVAMPGGKKEHEYISGNIYHQLRIRLEGSSCVPFTSGQSVHIPACNRYVYPDASVACAPEFTGIEGLDVLVNPVIVFEVLSPSTAASDRTAKKESYATLPSLSAYIVVSVDTPHLDIFTRQPDGTWDNGGGVYGLESTFSLPALGCELALADIYQWVEFPNTTVGDSGVGVI